jgi:outer membrane protein assembly factor BamB
VNTLNSYPWPHKLVSAQPGYTVEPFTLQMGGKLLYAGLKVRNSSGHLIYGGVQAFDPSEGEMLWGFEGQTVQNAALTLANGIVYLSVDHPDIVGRSLVFALRATDGRQLNDYDLPLSIEQLTVAGGFLYPLGYDNFYGVNLATGATWHISGSQGANQGFSDLHVASGVLYVSLYTKCTGSVILALNPATGNVILLEMLLLRRRNLSDVLLPKSFRSHAPGSKKWVSRALSVQPVWQRERLL